MICDKCKYEFFEGRNCPNCGHLAIFVKDDDYESRKAEWEEENKPEETPDKEPSKKKFSINVDKAKLKKLACYGTALIAAAVVLTAVILLITDFIAQKSVYVLYDNGIVIKGISGSTAFDSENAVFTADGTYAYAGADISPDGELLCDAVSQNGRFEAMVTVVGTDVDDACYYLYFGNRTTGELSSVVSDGKTIRIVGVVNDGSIIYEAASLGSYSVVIDSSIYLYNNGKSSLIADNVYDFVSLESDGSFIYYDTDMNAYLYSDGKLLALTNDELSNEGSAFVSTKGGKCYYLTSSGNLYDYDDNELIDSGVSQGTLSAVAGADKVTYVKDESLYIYGESIKKPTVLIEDYGSYGSRLSVYENTYKIYYVYGNTLYICNLSGTVKKTQADVNAVYFTAR